MEKSPLDKIANARTDLGYSRRQLLSAAGPAIGVAAASSASASAAALGPTKIVARVANVTDFGAKGDGVTDDSAAFHAALAETQVVEVPPGSFRIEKPLVLRDGQVLRGAGRSGWEPYPGTGAPSSAVRSEIVVDGRLAIDARNSNNAAVAGLAIRAKGARQSGWGQEPGFQPGAIGIDITGSYQFDAEDISFHGLEIGVAAAADDGRPTQMPHIGNWAAEDCATVIRLVSNNKKFYAVRDARIEGCTAALHCGRIIEARTCDGLRIENVRFFQCSTHSVVIENTPFVSITGATFFETKDETLVLRGCQYATMAGILLARAGYFKAGKLLQRSALVLEDCYDLAFQGVIEQPIGRAMTIVNCNNLTINAAIGTPFWCTGYLGADDGAIRIERSHNIQLDASVSGDTYWIAVWADAASGGSVGGHVSTAGTPGMVRCVQLQQRPWGHVYRASAPGRLAAHSSVELDVVRVLVPAGKTLVARSAELTAAGLVFEAGGQRFRMEAAPELGGGALSLERKLLHRNETSEPRYATIPIGLYNPTAQASVLPAGHEIRLSLGVE